MRYLITILVAGSLWLLFSFTSEQAQYDLILRNGLVYDGSGSEPYRADVAITGDRIAIIGNLANARATREIDIRGMAVAPGFINMLSWADVSLLHDGTSMSDIKQGVTLEVFGEGWSQGPVKRDVRKHADSSWTKLEGYFAWAMKKGVSPNIASFVGATTVRVH